MRLLQGKRLCAILLSMLILALSGCGVPTIGDETVEQIIYEPGVSMPVVSPFQQSDTDNPRRQTYQAAPQEWALYYRMRGENLLVRAMSSVDVRDKTLEESLIEALIEGPKSGPEELTGVFVSGTRIVRKDSEGDTLLITLSQHFLETPSDMPANWAEVPALRSEVYSRRRLALESIVSTITEETGYSAVQLYVAVDENDTIGRRINRSEIFEDDPDVLLSRVTRSEDNLLTHYNAADIILRSIQNKTFERLYRFVSDSPTKETFLTEMFGAGYTLTAYSLSSGMVSSDGQNAILVADLTFVSASGVQYADQYTLRIEQKDNLWKIKYDTLKRMMEAT